MLMIPPNLRQYIIGAPFRKTDFNKVLRSRMKIGTEGRLQVRIIIQILLRIKIHLSTLIAPS